MNGKRLRLSVVLVIAIMFMPALPLLAPTGVAEDDGPKGPWSLAVRVDNGPRASDAISSVRLVMDDEGRMFVGWLEDRDDGNDCLVSASVDGGENWGEDLRVDPYPNSPRALPTTCDVDVDGSGHVFATYTQRMVQGWRVRFARSDDGAQSFRTPSNVYDVVDPTEVQEHPEMAVSSHGSVYILFLDRTPTSSKLFMVRSDDGLNPLAPRGVESDQPTDVAHVQGDIAVTPDGTVYVAYGYRATGESGIKVGVKTPTQGSFAITEALVIEEGFPRELRPRLAVSDEGVVEVVYDPHDGEGRLKHIRSEDGATSFSTPTVIWAPGATNDVQSNPDMAFDSLGRINIVWTQGGDVPSRVYHSLSHDGISFTAPTELNGAWNTTEMGTRLWEDHAAILPMPGGGLAAAFAAKLNNTAGVFFTELVNEPPVTSISYPGEGYEVSGTVPVLGTAADPRGTTGLEWVYVQVGDADPVRLRGATSWEHVFDSTLLLDGWVTIAAWATDGFMEGPKANVTVDVDNNKPPAFSIGTPANGTTHRGTVRVAGTAHDAEGFGEGWKVQYSLDRVNWTDVAGGVLLDDHNMDYEVELDLTHLRKGAVEILVRVSDGDKVSEPKQVNVEMDNRPDLHIDLASLSWEPDRLKHGDVVYFTLRVENRGVVEAETYEVELRRGSQVVGLATGSNLPAGQSENVLVQWDARGGNNSLRFWVDSKEDLDELDESDNQLTFNVIVKKPETDGDGPSLRDIIWIIGVIAFLSSVGLAGLRWYMLNRPPPPEPIVETVYEGGGLYDEHGPYGEDQMTDAEEGPPSEQIGGSQAPRLDGDPTRQSEDWHPAVESQLEGNIGAPKESGAEHQSDMGGGSGPAETTQSVTRDTPDLASEAVDLQGGDGDSGTGSKNGTDALRPSAPEHAIGPDQTFDTPSMDAKDPGQLTQDADIDVEKAQRK